ncbi:NAD(P)-dependent oxidoreductase [Paenibacillus hunanensis]|uniref:NAD-dependent epimerase/dehydratase family protein n=1 Tax=Paenibacillus hunanensis TaxID=539262 RepID=UPI002026B084|nr:NAD(P)-dependent oxidoreductase [Paenibacillus hunanensis]MCL9662833.1 NAD(P)-dependent oxidoreductase [Paenibacillus hunanensis]
MMSKTALLGYSGYVGSTLLQQASFDDLYNSKNIDTISGKSYELIVCAAAPAVKWKANQEPEADLANLKALMERLKTVNAQKFILISTVDVYQKPIEVSEKTLIIPEETDPYGRHRFYLEQFVQDHFNDVLIVRLPGLFGEGLKKNFIYDLIYNNRFDLTHKDSRFQFYNMKNLWHDLQLAQQEQLKIVNFATYPVSASEIAEHALGIEFSNVTEKAAVSYNMLSEHAEKFGGSNGYFKTKEQILEEISRFIQQQKSEKQ